jgi:hypothetical protein
MPRRAPQDIAADVAANKSAEQQRLAEDRARSPEERLRMTIEASVTLLKLANAPRSGGRTRT